MMKSTLQNLRKFFILSGIALATTLFVPGNLSAQGSEATYVVDAAKELNTINKNIYGHFTEHLGRCIYGGIWVGEDSDIPNTRGLRNDVLNALKKINPPVIRWPGGCFADTYHWKDGIGPRDERPVDVNMFWGNVLESNAFGTHEFMDFIDQVGAEPYFAGNVGSGTPQEMGDWVEYLTYPGESTLANMRRENGQDKPWVVKYWGVGNENWGCGGNMQADYYADLYRRFSTYLRNYGKSDLYLVANGPSGRDLEWFDIMMREASDMMDGVSIHYYTITHNWQDKGSSVDFTKEEWFMTLHSALQIEELIQDYLTIMNKYDPEREIDMLVDEWGTWYNSLPNTHGAFLEQQNTLRDALAAAATLHIFNAHSDRIVMANIAQMVNVLQAMILTRDEQMVLTPTYHTFEMLKVHQDAMLLDAALQTPKYGAGEEEIPQVSASASKNDAGDINISFCNFDPDQAITVSGVLKNAEVGNIEGRVLTADKINAHNTFDSPETLTPASFSDFKRTDQGLDVTLPAKSLVVLTLQP